MSPLKIITKWLVGYSSIGCQNKDKSSENPFYDFDHFAAAWQGSTHHVRAQ
jgi:hypothetical protein